MTEKRNKNYIKQQKKKMKKKYKSGKTKQYINVYILNLLPHRWDTGRMQSIDDVSLATIIKDN